MALIHPIPGEGRLGQKADRSPDLRLQERHRLLHREARRGNRDYSYLFYPKLVVVRTSDFKSNEYANLIGGQNFELPESNPMIGFRGASRYISSPDLEKLSPGCQALKKVMEGMALINVIPMIPFCRTVEEGMSWRRWAAASLSETRTASGSTSCVRSPTT